MKSKSKKYAVLVIILILIVAGIIFVTKRKESSKQVSNSIQAPVTTEAGKAGIVNREFSFPIKNESGEEISQVKYTIQSAELRNEIFVKGQKATAVKGRTFLIMNIKLTNSLDKTIKINTRDYIRLIVNSNTVEPLAPEIHNDPVEVQPISTKITRIGFPINESDRDLQLQVGEIKGPKELVAVVL